MEETIEQIEDKLYEVLNALDDFMEKYGDSLNDRAYELSLTTFDSVDDVLNYLNAIKSELEETEGE